MSKKTSKAKKTRRYIPRQTRKFQLRLDDPKDRHVGEILDYARSQRREVTIIREAVALFWALENGNLEALFEKFPQYRAQFAPDNTALIEEFRQLLNQQSRVEAQPEIPGPKLLNTPKTILPLLNDDDDTDTIILKKDVSAAPDFFTSMLQL